MKSVFIKTITSALLGALLVCPVHAEGTGIFLSEGSRIYQAQADEKAGTDVIRLWEENSPESIRFYHDSEHTRQIRDITEIEAGQDVYYEVIMDEGYYLDTFWCAGSPNYSEYFTITDFFSIRMDIVCAGDFTDDSEVNFKDVAQLIRYCEGLKEVDSKNLAAGDYDRDGDIDSDDINAILKMILGWGNIHGGVQNDFKIMGLPQPTALIK